MKQKKRVDLFHAAVNAWGFYFITLAFAYITALFNYQGLELIYEYRQTYRSLTTEEYYLIQATDRWAGYGVGIGVLASLFLSVFIDRRNGYSWINSVIALLLLLLFGYMFQVIGISPHELSRTVLYRMGFRTVSIYLLLGVLWLFFGSVVFFTPRIQKFSPFRKVKKAMTFQFEETSASC